VRALVMAIVAGALLVGCRKRSETKEARAWPEAERIVSFSPALTEVAVDLELDDALVGASTFDSHPAVAELPRVGGMADPNLELLAALQPDLVLTTPSVARVEGFMDAQMPDVPVVVAEINTLSELLRAYDAIATKAGVPERGEAAASALRKKLAEHTREPEGARPRVLLVVGRDPGSLGHLTAAGPGTFLDELLHRAGGQNALPDDIGDWPSLGREAVLAHPPDVIVELSTTETPPDDAAAVWREHLPDLRAVADDRVYRLTGPHLLLPGPRVVETLRDLGDVLREE